MLFFSVFFDIFLANKLVKIGWRGLILLEKIDYIMVGVAVEYVYICEAV